MRFNRKRHLLLKVLTKKLLQYPKRKGDNIEGELVGLTFNEVDNLLKTNKFERHIILSELIKYDEIKIFNTKSSGIIIEPRIGVSAFSNKKYKKKNEDIIIGWFKVFAQIVVPIMSLTVAVLVLTLKFNSITESIESKVNKNNIKKLEYLELKLDQIILLENNRKNNPISPKNISD